VILIAMLAVLPVVLGFGARMTRDPKPEPAPAAEAKAVEKAAEAPKPAPDPAPERKESGLATLLSSPLFWVIGFAFLFFVPLETSVGGWATTLVSRHTPRDVPPERAQRTAELALTGYWMGFTGSRLIVATLGAFGILAKLLGEGKEQQTQRLLLVVAVASLVLTVALVLVRGRGLAIATVLLSGLAFGPVFPTMMGIVLLSVPEDTRGRAVGFFFFFASVGWTVIPALIGAVARKTDNIQKGFLVAAASGAIFLGFVIVRGMMV
jgi:fucose permease